MSNENEIPVWEKLCLTIEEASNLSGIGQTKIREMTSCDDCPFVIYIGSKRLVKRRQFEEYLEKSFSI